MYNKNIATNNKIDIKPEINTTISFVSDEIDKVNTKKLIRRNCSITANTIIHNLYITKNNSNLLGLLGCSLSANNNYEAICEWIYKKNPELTFIDIDIINKFEKDLVDLLSESRNYYY